MKKILFLIILLLTCSPSVAQQPLILVGEPDGSPDNVAAYKVLFTNGSLTNNNNGTVTVTLAAGSGDSVTVNSSAADTTANLLDGDIDFTLVDGGAGGPDDITATVACSGCVDSTDLADSLDLGGDTSFEIPNSAAPTTDAAGEIALDTTIVDHQPLWQYFDGGENMSIIAIDTSQLPANDNEIIKYDAATDKFLLEADAGGSGSTSFNLPIYSAKLTGAFVVFTPPTADACAQGAQIDAGDGNWRLLFDATTDECATWQFVIPNNYSSDPILKVDYSMASGTADEVEFEAAIMCVTPGDAADIGTASFSNVAVASGTVPGTVGHTAQLSITLTDDSCAAGDIAFIVISTDANDVTSDDALGDREVSGLDFQYTGS